MKITHMKRANIDKVKVTFYLPVDIVKALKTAVYNADNMNRSKAVECALNEFLGLKDS